MAHVRQLMAELLVRTNLNECAAQQEMAEQENEVLAKIRDACNARNMLREALIESKKRAEQAMIERKNRYEELQRLENQLDVCSAAAWLAITEKNRLNDRLAILSKQPHVEPCQRKKQLTEGCRLTKPGESEQYQRVHQTSRQSVSDGSVVTICTEDEAKVEAGSSVSPGTTETKHELLLPMNIMTTIQKVLHDSLGLDVAFEGVSYITILDFPEIIPNRIRHDELEAMLTLLRRHRLLPNGYSMKYSGFCTSERQIEYKGLYSDLKP
ncbi:hypothetical protein COOONC_18969 [Cooperia oncophora]